MQGQTQSISFDGREIRLTTGRYAPQAGGSVMIECGDTSVLVTATRSTGREGIDFLPLICDYEERLYAAGRNAVGVCSRQYVSGLSIADCVYSGLRAARDSTRAQQPVTSNTPEAVV